ncbi:hypothetical protein HRED_07027 [Candidatus Haloredivivus sp. G17]|nr:hypothetical protein HRED_07027 [Candidatus Haloredivivus sp. G17]
MQPDYDGEVYCWGNRCELEVEEEQDGDISIEVGNRNGLEKPSQEM